MTLAEARELLESCRVGDDRDSYPILRRMRATFQVVSESDRVVLNQVVRGWLVSDDAKDRYDGAWLTDELGLTANLDLIRRLRDEAERRSEHLAAHAYAQDQDDYVFVALAEEDPRYEVELARIPKAVVASIQGG